MTTVLFIQIVISFFVGGLLVTILSLIAEKASQHISGIIMLFPTTLVLGFFFLGYTTSAKNVSAIIPSTFIPLGIIILSAVIYIYCAAFFAYYIKKKIFQILCSLIISIIIWFLLVCSFAIYKFSNTLIGIIGFFAIIIIAHFILTRKKYETSLNRPLYTKVQILIRALFTGSIIATVVFLSKTLNPFWGGIFTMFPAATFTTLIILHFYYEPSQLFFFMRNAALGSISLFTYTAAVMLLFPILGIWIGTFVAYCISLIVGLLLIKLKLRQHRA